MAQSTCMKCDGHLFEHKELALAHPTRKVVAIQCSNCGGVVGVQDYLDLGSMLHRQERALRFLATRLGVTLDFD